MLQVSTLTGKAGVDYSKRRERGAIPHTIKEALMKTLHWLLVGAAGMGLMLFSSFASRGPTASPPWSGARMYVGAGEPTTETEGLEYVKARIRFLPMTPLAEVLAHAVLGERAEVEQSFRLASQEKLILYPQLRNDFTETMLASGRLPIPGKDEVVAGACATQEDRLAVGGRTFTVVGVLREQVLLFLDSYLIAGDSAQADLFSPDDEAVQIAYVVRPSTGEQLDRETKKLLSEAFPSGKFVLQIGRARTHAAQFWVFVSGQALFLLGGSILLTALYVSLASRLRPGFIRTPLAEIQKRKRLFLALHLVYFGAVVLFTALVHRVPELQHFLQALVRAELKEGPLAPVAQAYASKNVLWAALATLGINFALGSLAAITLPSLIVPGIGALMVFIRAAAWGLVLAPTNPLLLRGMVPHSLVLFLEGSGYVLAAFFALLVPLYLFNRREGETVGRRYGKALLMNLKGNLLVLIVLAVAALYEAIEVILQM